MSEPNLFVTTLHKGLGMHRKSPRIKGKRKPMKSKPVIRVGGRKVSAAPRNKTKYRFPVEVSYVGDTNRYCPFRALEGLIVLFCAELENVAINYD
jgi:hypothetical protein